MTAFHQPDDVARSDHSRLDHPVVPTAASGFDHAIDHRRIAETVAQFPAGLATLTDFDQSRAGACLMCADCRKACPRGLPVNDLMRIRMYCEEYGWPEHARSEFALLGKDVAALASGCGDCTRCAEVCPVRLASAESVRRVASLMA